MSHINSMIYRQNRTVHLKKLLHILTSNCSVCPINSPQRKIFNLQPTIHNRRRDDVNESMMFLVYRIPTVLAHLRYSVVLSKSTDCAPIYHTSHRIPTLYVCRPVISQVYFPYQFAFIALLFVLFKD